MNELNKALRTATRAEFERDALIKYLTGREECPPQRQCRGENLKFNNCYDCFRSWLSGKWERRYEN